MIHTPRCVIDALTEADMADIHRIVTMPEVARMLFVFRPDQTVDDIATFFRLVMDPIRRPARLAVRHRGRLIGSIGIGPEPEPAIYYFLDPAIAGQGVASEIVPAFCTHMVARHGLPALTAEVFCDNPASRRVLDKAGFVVTGDAMLLSGGRTEPAPGWQMRRAT